MKHTKRPLRQFALLTVAACALSPVLWAGSAAAAAATLYMSPSSGSYNNGSTITVSIRENSYAEPVNAVQANFSYPSSLQYLSISSSSAFGVTVPSTGGNGSVQIARGAMPAVTGDQLVATVQFKVLAGSGTAGLSFTGGSYVVSYNSNSNIMTSSPGANYTLTTPPNPSPSPSPSPRPSPTTPPPPPSPTAQPKPVVISGIMVSDAKPTSVTISWTTSAAASTELDYGLATSYGIAWVDTNLATTHKAVLDSPLIVPGTTYHFMIKSKDATGNTGTSADQTFTTGGATLTVTILDSKSGKPISGASVSYGDQKATTGADGKATLHNMPQGKVLIVVTIGGQQTTETVTIGGAAATGAAQSVSFRLTAAHANAVLPIVAFIVVALLAAASIVGLKLIRRFGGGSPARPIATPPPTSTPDQGGTVISSDIQTQGSDQAAPGAPIFGVPSPKLPQSSEVIQPAGYPRVELDKPADPHQP